MTLTILGGNLTPTPGDGRAQDAVYCVDEAGRYLGITQAANAAQAADTPPPSAAVEWRWVGGAWVRYVSLEARAEGIEAERDAKISSGVDWSGRRWYTDSVVQQQIMGYLLAFQAGLLPPGGTASVRAMDKVVYELTAPELAQLAGAIMAHVHQAYTESWAAKAAIQA